MKMQRELKRYLAEGGTLGALASRPAKRPAEAAFPCEAKDVFERQVAGLALRLKRIGVSHVVIGVSGGLDSTLCLLVAVAAFDRLGLDRSGIHVLTMPGFGTSRRTRGNAGVMCEALGLKLGVVPIGPACRRHLKLIGHDAVTPDVTYENAQARMRTLILMDTANLVGGIVLGTGDLSEIALGWSTYNGDHMSMFGVNAGVPKTVVRKVAAWYAQSLRVPGATRAELRLADAIDDVVATPVSPELVRGQVTEDRLGPYELHDFFLWNFIVNGLDRADLKRAARTFFARTYPAALIDRTLETFLSRLVSQAFKRNCAPDGIRVFPFDLGPDGWKIPSDLPKGILL